MKKLICTLLLTALALTAGELTGKWTGSFDITNSNGETKPDSAYMTLKVDGAKVTGTAGPNEDQQWEVRNGKLDKEKLTFDVAMPDGGSIVFDLVFDGETIQGNAAGTGDGGEKMTAKLNLKRAG